MTKETFLMIRPRILNLLKHPVLAALLTVGFAMHAGPASASKSDDTLRFATEQLPESIDQYFNNVRIGTIIGGLVWDTLLYRDPKSGDLKGQLAKSWKRTADRTLEFELRQGIKFHNGEEFDADSVVFTLNFVSNPANRVKTHDNVNWIEKAEKVDKYKVRIVTKTAFPAALQYLAETIPIYPAKYYAEVGPKGMSAKPVGTGPYKVLQYVPGKVLSFERNKEYFADSPVPKPQIGKVEIRFIPDRQTQMAEMLSGGLDLIMNVSQEQAEQIHTVPNLQVVSADSLRVAFIQLNELDGAPNKALKDVRVRRAIAHAIDRETIVKQIVGPGARTVHAVCHPSQFGCPDGEGVAHYAYDPARAKKLLAEAGFPNGFETEILVNRDRNQAEAIINNLAAVGIKTQLNFMQPSAARDLLRANKAQLAMRTWGSYDINDVSSFTPVFFTFEPDDIARDPVVRDLLVKGNSLMLPRERSDAYKAAIARIADQVHAIPLWTLPVKLVATKDLVIPNPVENLRIREMSWKR
jgi:peptide/nickel transport system substrate-binding protein